MRLVYKKYADGTYTVYQTDEAGRNKRVLESSVSDDKKVRRVPVFIEVNCDDDQIDDAPNGLDLLRKNLKNAQ